MRHKGNGDDLFYWFTLVTVEVFPAVIEVALRLQCGLNCALNLFCCVEIYCVDLCLTIRRIYDPVRGILLTIDNHLHQDRSFVLPISSSVLEMMKQFVRRLKAVDNRWIFNLQRAVF